EWKKFSTTTAKTLQSAFASIPDCPTKAKLYFCSLSTDLSTRALKDFLFPTESPSTICCKFEDLFVRRGHLLQFAVNFNLTR
ncbi:hypothetical protein FRX31_004376, partial [Thalictrum thalictroides]